MRRESALDQPRAMEVVLLGGGGGERVWGADVWRMVRLEHMKRL